MPRSMSRFRTTAFLCLLLLGCQPATDPTNFTLDLRDRADPAALLDQGLIEARQAAVRPATVGGERALAVVTNAEFSDVLLDVERLFGHPVALAEARYLHLRLYVPAGSWVRAIKINLADRDGNLGGIPEVANNFYGRYDGWFETVVDLRDYAGRYQNWVGEADLWAGAPLLSLNPYCAHQQDSSRFYVSYLALTDERPALPDPQPALAPRHVLPPGEPFTFTFDDDRLLHDLVAYRTFESSDQAFATGVAGNPGRAIRLRGRDHLNNIAFLPLIDKMTGAPADFTRYQRLFFDYYLTPESADFAGSTLTLATPGWTSVMTDSTFVTDFVRGAWTRASVDLTDLDLRQNWGTEDVLRQVAELRLNLNYRPGRKDVEMWVDNFGWE